MGKCKDNRRFHPRAGTIRGLRDIRTLGDVRTSVSLKSSAAISSVGMGPSLGRPAGSRALDSMTRPRAWVFTKKPQFSRHQGMLLVDLMSEPDVEVFDEGQSLVVLVELQGVRESDISVVLCGDVLIIETETCGEGARRYYREILLPFPVGNESVKRGFHNGVLEIEMERALERTEPGRRNK